MKAWPFFLSYFLLLKTALGQEVQWRADHLQRQVFSYHQVCQAMGVKEAPLIEAQGSQLDCMGQKVSLRDFCLQQSSPKVAATLAPKPFLRAVALEKRREVACEYGMRGILELSCRKVDCQHPQQQCQALGQVYAKQLDLVHSGVWAAGDLEASNFDQQNLNQILTQELNKDLGKNLDPSFNFDLGLSIFAFSQLKLECIYEAKSSFWGPDDGRL